MPFISGIGLPEVIIILVIALIVVGPGRLPDVGSALGKSIREFRKAATDVKEATSLEPLQDPPAHSTAAASQGTSPTSYAPPPSAASATPLPPSVDAPPVVGSPSPVDAPSTADAPSPAAMASSPAATASSPDIADMPEPVRSADEQPTRTS
jgi:TatA/E family protein of Tat protein translocase